MKNEYLLMREKHQQQVNELPLFFAFTDEQFEQGKKEAGILDNKELYSIGYGGFIAKKEAKKMSQVFENQHKERREALLADTTGTGFAYQAFLYELDNHEYGYTCDPSEAIDALGLSENQITENTALLKAFTSACKTIKERD